MTEYSNEWTWDYYKGNLNWLKDRTIYLTVHGSKSYGTNTPESDTDYRGVAIAPVNYYLGVMDKFEQAEMKEPDCTIFAINKFVSLASQCNPNVIEILYTDDSNKIIVNKLGEKLLEMRDLFLTKRVRHTFSGYATAQYKRIKTHRKWLINPLTKQPVRSDFGLLEKPLIPKDQLEAAESAIRKKVDSWSFDFLDDLSDSARIDIKNKIYSHLEDIGVSMNEDLWIGAARQLGFHDNFIEYVAKEKKYTAAKRDWDSYIEWKKNRNPKRAELEAKYGFDGKHAGHLFRLLNMAKEILQTGKVLVKRPDAETILAIRNGAWSYEQLEEWFERENAELPAIEAASKLPKIPDIKEIDKRLIEIVEESFK